MKCPECGKTGIKARSLGIHHYQAHVRVRTKKGETFYPVKITSSAAAKMVNGPQPPPSPSEQILLDLRYGAENAEGQVKYFKERATAYRNAIKAIEGRNGKAKA